jgi:hypothetical protein
VVSHEDNMPTWRSRARASVAPYRRALSVAALALMASAVLNSIYDWGLLGLHGRRSESLGLFVGLVWYVFIGPTPSEIQAMKRAKSGL